MNAVHGRENLRDRLISAAQELFAEGGVDAVTMRRVAERVGVTAPALYRHFKDKDELLGELINVGLQILQGYLEPAFGAPGPEERLRLLIDHYFEFAVEQPRYFDLAFLIPSHGMELSAEIGRHNRSTFLFAVQQVQACMELGALRRDDPLETAILLWAEAHGLITLFRLERFGSDPQIFRAVFRRSIGRLLEGLRPD